MRHHQPMNAINTDSTEIVATRLFSVALQVFCIGMESSLMNIHHLTFAHSQRWNGHEMHWNVIFCYYFILLLRSRKLIDFINDNNHCIWHMSLDIFDNNVNQQSAVKSGLKMASLKKWKSWIEPEWKMWFYMCSMFDVRFIGRCNDDYGFLFTIITGFVDCALWIIIHSNVMRSYCKQNIWK